MRQLLLVWEYAALAAVDGVDRCGFLENVKIHELFTEVGLFVKKIVNSAPDSRKAARFCLFS